MSFFSLIEPDITSHLTMVLLHALWQGLLVWLVMVFALRLLKKRSAALRYGLSVTGLWVMLLLPVLTWFLVDVNEVATGVSVRETSVDDVSQERANSVSIPVDMTQVDSVWSLDEHETTPADSPESADQNLDEAAFNAPVTVVNSSASPPVDLPSFVVAVVWLTGVLLLSLRLLLGYAWTLRVSYTRLQIDSELRCRLKGISASLGWKSIPRVFLSSHIKEAIVVGYLKPLVLIPVTWTTQLTPEAIEAVIIHELTHIRRFDLWVILVQRIAETLLFFHPAVWLLSKRISYERELCCDAESARLLDSNLSYATSLEQVARYLFEQTPPARQTNWLTHTLSPTFGGQKMELLARVQHVLSLSSNTPHPPINPRRHYHGLTMLMIPALLLGLGISLVHAMGEEPEPIDQTAQVRTKPNQESLKEAEGDTGKLLFGVGVNSDTGVVGQIVLDDFEKPKDPLLPTDVVAIVNETPVTAFDVLGELLARLSKEQHRYSSVEFREVQDRMLEKRLPPHIDQLLMVNAVKARLSADQLDKIMEQLDDFFEQEIDRLKQDFNVTEVEELQTLLDDKGTSLDLMKQMFVNRQVSFEYLRGKLAAFDDASSSDREAQTKQVIAELRKTASIKTIFDDDWELHQPEQKGIVLAVNNERGEMDKESDNPFADLEFIETPDGPAIDISHEQFQKKRYLAELDGENWYQLFETAAFAGNTNDTFQQIQKLKGIVDPLGGKLISMSGIRQEILDNDPTRIRVTLLRKEMTVNIHYGSDPKAETGSEDLPRIPPPLSDELIQALADLDVLFRLFLTRDTATDDSLARLASNKQLVSILVESKHVTEDGLKSLLKIPQLKQLEWLNPCTASGLVEIAKHQSIESLMINAKLLDSDLVKPLGDLVQLNRLSISLGRNLDGTFINTLLKLKNLETLQLQFVQFDSEDLKQLHVLKKIKSFDFNPGLDDDLRLDDETVRAALSLPVLQSCALHHATLSAETLADVKGSNAEQSTKQHRSPCLIYDCTVIDESGGRKTHDLISIHRADKPTPKASPRRQDSSDHLEIEYSKLPAEWKRKLNKQEQKAWAEVAQVDSRETLQIEQPPESRLQAVSWEEMSVRGYKLRVDVSKSIVRVEQGVFEQTQDRLRKILTADHIEVQCVKKPSQRGIQPTIVRATGNVQYSYQHSPVLDANPSLIRGDELTWDLVNNQLEVRSATQVIQLRQTPKDDSHPAASNETNASALTDADWNSRHHAALAKTVKLDYPDASLATVVADLNERFFAGRMEFDTQALKEEGLTKNIRVSQELNGITLQSALNLLLGDFELGYLVEGGKVTVSTKRRQEKREVERHLKRQKEIELNLEKRISLDFKQKPLSDFVGHLADTLGIIFVIDDLALSELGISSDVQITVKLENVRAETMLSHVLKSLDLAYKIEDKVLNITSRERAQGPIHVTIYKLDESMIDPDQVEEDVDSLIKLIRTTVAPDSWDTVGGAGAIHDHGITNSLVIRQHEKIHAEVKEFLQALRDVRGGKQPKPAIELPEPTQEEIKVNRELKKNISIFMNGVPLYHFVETLTKETGTNYYLDSRGLAESGITLAWPVSCNERFVPAISILNDVLSSNRLEFQIEENIIVISSPERCSGPVSTVIYSTKGLPKEKLGLEGLSQHLVKSVAYGTWVNHGGSGVATFDPKSETLIIRQSARVHQQLAAYLENMRLPVLDDDESIHFDSLPLR